MDSENVKTKWQSGIKLDRELKEHLGPLYFVKLFTFKIFSIKQIWGR